MTAGARRDGWLLGVTVACVTAACGAARADVPAARHGEWALLSVRTGADDSSLDESFTQVDAHADYALGSAWMGVSGWGLRPHLEMNGGVLSAGETTSVVVSAGPGAHLLTPTRALTFWVGVSPTWLSDHRFGVENLGSHFHFTSYVGVSVGVGEHARVTYRFQHTSNADIWPVNPGLNMHIVGLGWRP